MSPACSPFAPSHSASSSALQLEDVCRVRHEAGEALGAIGTATCLKELQQYLQDPCVEVSDNNHNETATGIAVPMPSSLLLLLQYFDIAG